MRATRTLAHANAGKNVILGIANGVAAILFAFLAPVHWPAVLALGIGCLIGSRLGPIVVRHAPAAPLRAVIGVAGLALAVKLGIDAYVNAAARAEAGCRNPWRSVEWVVALGYSRADVDQVLRARMQSLPGVSACLPHQIARPGALDDDAELETRHRDIPIQT